MDLVESLTKNFCDVFDDLRAPLIQKVTSNRQVLDVFKLYNDFLTITTHLNVLTLKYYVDSIKYRLFE